MNRINLADLPRETLIELVKMYSRNWQTLDGLWFGNVEKEYGLDAAVRIDLNNWEKQSVIEAERIKKILALDGGLSSVLTVLSLMSWQLTSPPFVIEEESAERVIISYAQCAVQEGRAKQKKALFPCKPMKLALLTNISRVVEPQIRVKCLSCPPDAHPDGYWCKWELSRGSNSS